MTTRTSDPSGRRVIDDEKNERFHVLLREAAEQRERRQRTQAAEDTAAARRELADFLALAGRSRDPERHRGARSG